jgi:hypothetical protein
MRVISVYSRSATAFFIASTLLIACLFSMTLLCPPVLGQEAAAVAAPQPLITQAIDESQLTVLKGNTHPLARPQYDLGAAPATLPMERMLLVLKRSPEQELALTKLLDNQQDKQSPNYHQWLTPEQFGKTFGPTDYDMQVIVGWLQSHGFQVGTTKGRTMLEFSGSASQVQEAFHTTIHKYLVNGERHWANASDPQIPAALAPAVAGVWTLHNFLKKPQYILSKEKGTIIPGKPPQLNISGGGHALVPGDYAVIYNINPVYASNINGNGITIGVIGRSEILLSDFTDYLNLFSLTSNTPHIVVNGPDPGDVPGDDAEGTLDATWSQLIAPGATVDFVASASTDTTDGIDLSELYIIENNLADVMTESFGGCEAGATNAEATGVALLAEQAAAQGISYMVSAGDNGAEGCDNMDTEIVATGPISVNLLASTPFTVGVGGTVFNENGHNSTYWSSTNTANGVSALSYIPEDVWNDSCPASSCGSNANIWAGSGGVSSGNTYSGGTFTGFAQPSWQTGVTGIPTNPAARYLPDVSLTAAPHDGYVLCLQGSCANQEFGVSGGTSASAPSFAGIMALVDQKMGARQGQPDYVLYPLAATENSNLSKCNGSSTSGLPANTCIFNDVTVGNNEVPGEAGYPNAPYNSGVGYDPASGLGSVNVANLVSNWHSATFRPTITTLSLSPTTNITHGQSVTVNIGVTVNSGTGTPSGDVSLLASVGGSTGGQSAVGGFTLASNGTYSGTTKQLPGGKSYSVWAHYAGNANTATGFMAASDSSKVTVTVSPENSTTTLDALTLNQSSSPAVLTSNSSIPYGDLVYLHASVAGNSGAGIPTGTVGIFDNATAIPGSPLTLSSDGSAATPNALLNLPVGSQSITATYNGDPSFNSSPSTPLNFTIAQAPTSVTLAANPQNIATNGVTQLKANLTLGTSTLASYGNAPTGTVTFSYNGTSLGSANVTGSAGSIDILTQCSLTTCSGTGATGSAQMTTANGALPNGSDTITATYSGDANYATSTGTVVVTVGGTPDFTLPTGGLGTVTISAPGGSGSVNLSITQTNGFNSVVNFTCVSGLPTGAACGAGTIAAGQTTGSMTVTTTAPHSALMLDRRQSYVAWWMAGGGIPLAGIFLLGTPKRRRCVLIGMLVPCCLVVLPSCGGSSGRGGGGGGGTPPGTYTVNVTATSGTLSHNTSFKLVVQ